MNMNDMFEITRLVGTGGLMEATVKIQRGLHGIPPLATTMGANDTTANASIIEGGFRAVDDAPHFLGGFSACRPTTRSQPIGALARSAGFGLAGKRSAAASRPRRARSSTRRGLKRTISHEVLHESRGRPRL